ncbi:MAG: hypothetical protein GQ532_05425 [Methylomarinum sp.]|nr:hypothetical protein [Methylomarinum sp.]
MTQKNIKIFSILSLSFLASLSHADNTNPQHPILADISSTSNCHFLHDINSNSGYSKHINWKRHTTHKALLKAEQFGATHLVIDNVESIGAFNGKVHGKAYKCNTLARVTSSHKN